jgi:uncharacterized membrane protein
LTGSNARVVFTRRARTVGGSVHTTFGRRKNTEAHTLGQAFCFCMNNHDTYYESAVGRKSAKPIVSISEPQCSQSFKDSKLVSWALVNLVAAARTMQCEIKVMIRIKKRFTNLIYRTSTLSQ